MAEATARNSSPVAVREIRRRGDRELVLLSAVSEVLAERVEFTDIAGPVLQALAEHMGMMRGTLTLLDRRTEEITIEAALGLSEPQIARGRYRLGEGVTGEVIAAGQPAVVPRVSKAPDFLDRTGARARHKRDISFLCVPIVQGGEVLGALSADRLYDEDTALDEDLRLMSIVASMLAGAARKRAALLEERRLQREPTAPHAGLRPKAVVGRSKAIDDVFALLERVAASDTTVLIRGESGVGKELVARAVHDASARCDGPFIKVNCAALPDTLIESELFGHERGAFTGAVNRKKGRFELADGGTLFLDEVGDFSPMAQVKLLRALQERSFERVGGTETLRADVRVIAATNRDLERMVEDDSYRADLYWRLNVFDVHVPPLRERKSDVLLLADHFVQVYAEANDKVVRRISTPAIDMLTDYHWPGNVRELENCIERAVLLTREDVIRAEHLPPTLQTPTLAGAGSLDLAARLDGLERELLVDALKAARGNRARAARALGISERLMGLRVAKHQLDIKRFKAVPTGR